MTVTLHEAGDRERLEELLARERGARQRERYRSVLLTMDHLGGDEIARRLGRSTSGRRATAAAASGRCARRSSRAAGPS